MEIKLITLEFIYWNLFFFYTNIYSLIWLMCALNRLWLRHLNRGSFYVQIIA